jgi:hypothetical protein
MTRPKQLVEVVTVGDFIKHLQDVYDVNAPIPTVAKQMLKIYLPALNLPKKKNGN